MAITEYKVEPLFAEPVFRANIGHAISAEQEEYLKNLKMVENRDNLISEDLYIFPGIDIGKGSAVLIIE